MNNIELIKNDDRTLQNFKLVLDHGVLDYLETRDLYKLRRINKVYVTPCVTGICFWDRLSKIQEQREKIGKRVFLFKQFMMSREDAAKIPPSTKYY